MKTAEKMKFVCE